MRRLLPNTVSYTASAGRCGRPPVQRATSSTDRWSAPRRAQNTHRTKEPPHASQHAPVEETWAQHQTSPQKRAILAYRISPRIYNNRKKAADSNSSTRSAEKTLRSHSLQSQGTIANSTKTPSQASHDKREAQPAKRLNATSLTHRIRVCDACKSAKSASTQEEAGGHLRCQRSSDPNRRPVESL